MLEYVTHLKSQQYNYYITYKAIGVFFYMNIFERLHALYINTLAACMAFKTTVTVSVYRSNLTGLHVSGWLVSVYTVQTQAT